jgi:putative ABC transport system ATP-binding protein
VALYGPSGSGKTTLLELISGMLWPDSGTVLVAGQDVFAMSHAEMDDFRLRQLGIIGQPHNLIPGARAIENASLKLLLTHGRRRGRPVIEELLEQLELKERMWHRTEELSMGERQRVLIAMALALEPKLVLADEPTGSLDTRQTRKVLGMLRRLCVERGAAMLLATHDPLAAGFADRVHELRDGRLQEYSPEHVVVATGSLRGGA